MVLHIITSDSLSKYSREFFERTKMKMAISFAACVFAMLVLALAAESSGFAASNKTKYDREGTAQVRLPYYSSGMGAGVAAFCFVMAWILLCFTGIYISPICTGSINERKTLCSPQEIRSLAVGGDDI